MTAVFLDTVGLVALWDIADQWHGAAELAFSQLVASRTALVTTSLDDRAMDVYVREDDAQEKR